VINVRADHVTIADLTIKRSYYHPIHVGGGGHYAMLYNLHIIDGRQQFVKVNPSGGEYNDYGTLACSLFELTPAGRSNVDTVSGGCYTGGLDAHQTWGWIVRDNIIKDIHCTNGGLAEHAIHFWKTNRDPIVERNTIIDCARGIGFGLGSDGGHRIYPDEPLEGTEVEGEEDMVGHIGGVIRNNMIFSDTTEYDTGIGLEQAWNVTVYHNTIYGKQGNSWNSAIDTRFENSDPIIKNNLFYPRMTERNEGHPTKADNVLATADMFVDADNGDLHLVDSAASVIDRGNPVGVLDDIDSEFRDSDPDIGADEYATFSAPPICYPTTEICGNGNDEDCDGSDDACLCTSADTDKDNLISSIELKNLIDAWKKGSGDMQSLLLTIRQWKEGC